MRTLKKALSLVLVLAMVLSLGVSAFAVEKAADYSDYADVKNTEAVDVLTAIGVLNGNDDGTFGPEGNFTRAAAAKIIAYMTLGKTLAEALPATATEFSDVPATHWASKYIQYCVDEGIIGGNGDGTFAPEGVLTASAWSKMLLCALGYDATVEGLTGTGWEIATTRLAISAGIASADDMTATFNRDAAAKLALNTLTATEVEYKGGSTVTVNGITFTSGAERKDKTWGSLTGSFDYTTGAAALATTETVEFCESHFKTLTKLATATTDDFGRPASTWALDSKPIGVYAKTPVLTYTGKVTGGQVYTDLGKPATATFTAYWDGYTNATNDAYFAALISSGEKNPVGVKAGFVTGVGTQTEIYKTGTNTYTVVFVNTYVGTINTYKDAVKDANGDITTKEYVTIDEVSANGTLTNDKFETTAFEKADQTASTVVLYTRAVSVPTTWDNFVVKSAVAAEKVENVAVTAYTGTSVTAGGTTYPKAAQASAATATPTMTGGATYNLFLDSFGNVIHMTAYAGAVSTDYVMVTAITGNNTGATYLGDIVETPYRNVKYVDMEGKETIVKVAVESSSPFACKDTAGSALTTSKIYTVSEDSTKAGYYKFKAVATVSGTVASTLNKTTATVATSSTIVANASTVFVLKTSASPVTYKVVTGISSLPSYTSASGTVYAVVGSDTYADVVFMQDISATPASTSTKDVIYLMTKTGVGYDAEKKVEYDVYSAVVKGELSTVKVVKDADMSSLTNKLVAVNTLDANGFMTAAGTAEVSTGYTALTTALNNVTVKFSAPVLTLNTTYIVSDDCVVYMIDANDQLTVGTPADLVGTTAATGNVAYLVHASTTDSTVTAIYFDGTITK